MREQGQALKYISDAALGYWKIDVLVGVEQSAIRDGDAARVGLAEAGYAIQQSRLTRSGGAEENREAGGGLEFDFEDEALGLRSEVLAELRVKLPDSRFVGARFGLPRLG
jgi:hypothetical protein